MSPDGRLFPQGTKLNPWLFLIMINDLSVVETTSLWEYADNHTLAELVSKNEISSMPSCVSELVWRSEADGFQQNVRNLSVKS